jgi:hypothetical protein
MGLFERVDEGMMNMNKGRKKRKKWKKKFIAGDGMLDMVVRLKIVLWYMLDHIQYNISRFNTLEVKNLTEEINITNRYIFKEPK